MLGKNKGKLLTKYVPDYIVFDLETTGVMISKDEIIEISAVKVRDGKVVEEFSELVNPGRPIPYDATRVNNITDEMVRHAPCCKEVLGHFFGICGRGYFSGA